jgi:hypothetical protein
MLLPGPKVFIRFSITCTVAYEECFSVREEQLQELHALLADRWDKKNLITFYELQDHYRIREVNGPWDRIKLIQACQYIHLCDHFDAEFWSGLLKDCPAEARSIVAGYGVDDVYFE